MNEKLVKRIKVLKMFDAIKLVLFQITNFALLFYAGFTMKNFFFGEPVTFWNITKILLYILGGIAAGIIAEGCADKIRRYNAIIKAEKTSD